MYSWREMTLQHHLMSNMKELGDWGIDQWCGKGRRIEVWLHPTSVQLVRRWS